MAHYANSTCSFSDWKFNFTSYPYGEAFLALLVFFYGMKVQLQKHNRQKNLRIIKDLRRKIMQLLGALLNYYACIKYWGYNHTGKPVKSLRVIPYENKTIPKVKKKFKDKHPWDIAEEIILE